MAEHPLPTLEDYPSRTYDKVRYADTDRQGHVNNAAFSTFLETGRVEILYAPEGPLADEGAAFVIAHASLDYRAELTWPGRVDIGTRVARIGRSSITLEQGLFQVGRCAALAETVIVQMSEATRRSHPLTDRAVTRLEAIAAG
jgi:acyl-CoA thioester hydrolase